MAPSIALTTSSTDDPIYDGQPCGAIQVAAPLVPSTRNFVSGIWVVTKGGAVDKGRGIFISNYGASDGLYIQLDGVNGTGLAVQADVAGTTAAVLEPRNPTAMGLVVREGPGGGGANLLTLGADQPGGSEMVRINSVQAGKAALVFRMAVAGNKALVVLDGGGSVLAALDADTGHLTVHGAAVQGLQPAQAGDRYIVAGADGTLRLSAQGPTN